MTPLQRLTIFIVTILSLTACTGGDKATIAMLERAEALMEDYPDSAYTLLYNIDSLRIESDDAPTSLRAPNVRSNTSIIQPKDITTSRKTFNRVGINNQIINNKWKQRLNKAR